MPLWSVVRLRLRQPLTDVAMTGSLDLQGNLIGVAGMRDKLVRPTHAGTGHTTHRELFCLWVRPGSGSALVTPQSWRVCERMCEQLACKASPEPLDRIIMPYTTHRDVRATPPGDDLIELARRSVLPHDATGGHLYIVNRLGHVQISLSLSIYI